MSDYKIYLKSDNDFHPAGEATSHKKLPPGSYFVNFDGNTGKFWFTQFNINCDELVDLPGTAYDVVMQDLKMFLTEDCKDRHDKVRILHKMNTLLYGPPGTGKTGIVNRVAQEVIKGDGIVLFNPHPELLKMAYNFIDKFQPETRVLVIFEELDQLLDDYDEGAFLHILDGEIQRKNSLYIATTNYIDQIPMRIRRPGRFALRLEVGFPNAEARFVYLQNKLSDPSLATKISEMTAGFSVDNLKEVVRAHVCMKKDLTTVVNSLRKEFNITENGPQDPSEFVDDVDPRNGFVNAVNSGKKF